MKKNDSVAVGDRVMVTRGAHKGSIVYIEYWNWVNGR